MDHLVANRDEARALHDLIRVAVLTRQHRARHAARDAAIPQAEIFVAVERSVPEASGARQRGNASASGGERRRNLPVFRIDDEPRPAAPGDLVDVAELGGVADETLRVAAEELGSGERVLLALGDGCRHLLRCDAFDSAPLELLGLLERRAGLVLVRVVALQIRIAPRRFRRSPRCSGGAAGVLGTERRGHRDQRDERGEEWPDHGRNFTPVEPDW